MMIRGAGLAAASLAASGMLAYVTWSYISGRKRKEAGNISGTREDDQVEPSLEKQTSECLNVSAVRQQNQDKRLPNKQVLVLGLDGSGKTSVIHSIVTNRGAHSTTPTEGFNAVCVATGDTQMEFLEIGGNEYLRPYWKMYLPRAFAVLYVVDSADYERFPLAKMHLHQLIKENSTLPLVVLANKQDLQNAYYLAEIHDVLELDDILENRKLFLIGAYVTKDGSEISSGIEHTRDLLEDLYYENYNTEA
ncbi:ADP-ribosylation factor-like protein 9 [Rhinophrynus dorsalis]